MVMVYEGTPEQYYMNGFLKANMDHAKEEILNDWDMLFCVDGVERSGKSTLAQQMAKFCDPTFDLARLTFSPNEFVYQCVHAAKYQAVVYDEAMTGMGSQDTSSQINKALKRMLMEIGQKNLFIFVVMPSYFELSRYVALHRSRALIHVYAQNFKRGQFLFFSQDKCKLLYLNGKKTYDYGVVGANFRGDFGRHYTVPEEAYRQKKAESLKHYVTTDIQEEVVSEQVELAMTKKLMDAGKLITDVAKAKILGITVDGYYKRRNKLLAKEKDQDFSEELHQYESIGTIP